MFVGCLIKSYQIFIVLSYHFLDSGKRFEKEMFLSTARGSAPLMMTFYLRKGQNTGGKSSLQVVTIPLSPLKIPAAKFHSHGTKARSKRHHRNSDSQDFTVILDFRP